MPLNSIATHFRKAKLKYLFEIVYHISSLKMTYLVLILLAALVGTCVRADDNTHVYTENEAVSLWVNTIGPFHNPTEMYAYYDLPYCHPDHGIERHKRPAGMGEILEGYELRNSGVKMHFATDVDNEVVCEMKLDSDQAQHFEKAVDQQYWYVHAPPMIFLT